MSVRGRTGRPTRLRPTDPSYPPCSGSTIHNHTHGIGFPLQLSPSSRLRLYAAKDLLFGGTRTEFDLLHDSFFLFFHRAILSRRATRPACLPGLFDHPAGWSSRTVFRRWVISDCMRSRRCKYWEDRRCVPVRVCGPMGPQVWAGSAELFLAS